MWGTRVASQWSFHRPLVVNYRVKIFSNPSLINLISLRILFHFCVVSRARLAVCGLIDPGSRASIWRRRANANTPRT